MAFDKTKPQGSDLIADIDTLIQANNAVVCQRSVFWLSQYPVVSTGSTWTEKAFGIQYTMRTGGTITKCWARMTTAPTGSSLIVDINKNGTTIWTNQANRLTVAASATSGSQTSFDVLTFVAGDVITLEIDQVGSTVAGVGLTVQFDYEIA